MKLQQHIDDAMKYFNVREEENQEIHIGKRIDDFDTTFENTISFIKAMKLKEKRKVKRKVKFTLAYDLDYPYFLIVITK